MKKKLLAAFVLIGVASTLLMAVFAQPVPMLAGHVYPTVGFAL